VNNQFCPYVSICRQYNLRNCQTFKFQLQNKI